MKAGPFENIRKTKEQFEVNLFQARTQKNFKNQKWVFLVGQSYTYTPRLDLCPRKVHATKNSQKKAAMELIKNQNSSGS